MQKLIAFWAGKRLQFVRENPSQCQKKVFKNLIKKLSRTRFGRDHRISSGMTVHEFQKAVPIFEYEDYAPYLELLKTGEKNILWPGVMECFCLSSGTTSGEKKIPIYSSAVYAILKTSFFSTYVFMSQSKVYHLFKRKIFHLYGMSVMKVINGIKHGYIGHLSNSKVPPFLVRSKYPNQELNYKPTWKEKIDGITIDIIHQDLSVLCGTPPWMNNFLEAFYQKHGTNFSTKFPHLTLYVHGGCSFENYREEFFKLLGKQPNLWTQENYPATEGFIAFQDHWDEHNKTKQQDLLLNVNSNIFFEFLPYENGAYDAQTRLTVDNVEVGKIYTLAVTTIGTLISYVIGDNIQITSKIPLRIKFAGRAKQNVNLVNEHMDFRTLTLVFNDLKSAFKATILDYVLLPKIDQGQAYYHWLLEMDEGFSLSEKTEAQNLINEFSRARNPFYNSWYKAGVLKTERVSFVKKGSLLNFLKQRQSMGQNKVPNVIQGQQAQSEFERFLEEANALLL